MKKSVIYGLSRIKSLKDYWILFIVIIIVTIFISAFSYLAAQNRFSKELDQDRANANYKVISQIDDSFAYIENLTNFIAKRIQESNSNDKEEISSILQMVKPKIDEKRLDVFTWTLFDFVDPKGYVTAASTIGAISNPVHIDEKKRSWMIDAKINPWKLHASKKDIGVTSGEEIIPLGFGVTDKKGNLLGIVSLGINVKRLIQKSDSVTNNKMIKFIIFDDQNSLIGYSENFSETDGTALKKITGNLSLNKDFEIDGIKYSFGKSQNYPIKVVTFLDNLMVQKKFWESFLPRILNSIYLTLFFLALLYFFRFWLLKPIIELSKAAKKIAKNDFDVSVPKSNIFEISLLSESINSLKFFLKQEEELKEKIRNAEKSAVQANQAKQKIIDGVSHDIRNYISRIINLSEIVIGEADFVIKEKNIDQNKIEKIKEEHQQHLKLIHSQSRELLLFVEDLLDNTQTQSGKFTLGKKTNCDINEVIKSLLDLNKGFLIKEKITVNLEIEKDLPLLNCDVRRFKQIISNLLSNAAKYSNENGIVTISAKHLENLNQILIEISDQGIGMSKDQIDMALSGDGKKIEKLNLKKKIDSHGIGLPMVQQLIDLHEAKMEIDSKQNSGTTFKLFFPIKNDDMISGDLFEEQNQNINILIVDDQEVNLLMTKFFLEKQIVNILCDIAKSADEAFTLIKEKKYDLILTDIQMPEMDGFEMATEIRKSNQQVPIIAYSSTIADNMIEKLHPEIDQFLSKPIKDDLLVKTIMKWTFINQENQESTIEELNIINGKKALIADDEELNLSLMKKILEKLGIIVETAKNGKELIEKYQNNDDFDLIISDIKMPIIDGFLAAKQIRDYEITQKFYHKTPIIAYSGDKDKQSIHKSFRSGIDDYYVKGESKEKLIKMIAFWIKFNDEFRYKSQLNQVREKAKLPQKTSKVEFDEKALFDEELIAIFRRDAARLISEINHANKAKDLQQFNFSSHALKGICGMLKIQDMFEHVTHINSLAKQGELASKKDLEKLQKIFKKTEDELMETFFNKTKEEKLIKIS